MASLSEKFKTCGVKIQTTIAGVPSSGSGVIYTTSSHCNYNYILTAKHIFQEDSKTPLKFEKISFIEVFYSKNTQFNSLAQFKKKDIKARLIPFEDDLAIVVVDKVKDVTFNQYLVTESLEDGDEDFYAWGIFSANQNQLHKFTLKRNDPEAKRFSAERNLTYNYLPGLSGAGVFHANKSILFGVIGSYPNEEFQNSTIDCIRVSFSDINSKLRSLNKVELDSKGSEKKREIDGVVVDINQALINGVYLDLDLARQRLKTDLWDDWFHDPLKYVDLLNNDYLFAQLKPFFSEKEYFVADAEKFDVPKKEYTLRRALVSPFIDRIMYIALVGVLGPKLDQAMIPNVYSSRYDFYSKSQLILNGVEQWQKMRHKINDCVYLKDENGNFAYGCVIEIDILNFYDNINKDLLYRKILRVCENANEEAAAKFLFDILKRLNEGEAGIPQNSDASSLLASFYLNQVDTFIFYRVPAYYRFMDDVRIFCSNKYEARKILQLFESELRRCNLSVNSQKTRILRFVDGPTVASDASEAISRTKYEVYFDYELNKMSKLRGSKNYVHLNEAFHLSLKVLRESLAIEDPNDLNEASRKLNYALNTIALLVKRTANIGSNKQEFEESLNAAVSSLKDKPWITNQVCKVLNLIPTDKVSPEIWRILSEIVLEEKYNTYAFQTYQVWLLLAKHRYTTRQLTSYAVEQIEKNDDTKRSVIGAMIIYMSTIDKSYRRVVLRKFQEGFARGNFQRRSVLIALRSFPSRLVRNEHLTSSLDASHEFTHKFKDKDLVFVPGASGEDESDQFLEQLFSIT